MRTIESIEIDLKEGITAVLVPLQTTRVVDAAGLERLVQWASEGAAVLKGRDQLPRSFLNELYVAAQVLRREGQHNEQAVLPAVADRLESVFALILVGESPRDRQPGSPRVV